MNASVRPISWFAIVSAVTVTAWATTVRAQNASLTVSTDAPTTADRVTLNIAYTVPPGWTIEPWSADARDTLEEAGWTVVSIEVDAPRVVAGSDAIRHAGVITIEPFLPGVYPLPHIMAKAVDSEGGEQQLITGERTIEVASLLPEDEVIPSLVPVPDDPDSPGLSDDSKEPEASAQTETADAPLGEFRPVPDESTNPGPLLTLIGSAIALIGAFVAIGVAVRSARGTRGEAPLDPVRELRRLAGSVDPDLARVDRAVRALSAHPGAGHNTENQRMLGELIADLERARYASVPAGSAQDLANRANRLARVIEATPVSPQDAPLGSLADEPVRPGEEAAA